MVPSSNTLDLLAGTRGWRSGTPIVLTCGLCRRRRWSPRRNRLSGRRGRHNLGGRPGSTRSGWPYGFRPGVETSCVSAFTRVPRRDDQGSRTEYCARSGLAAQSRRATRTGLCQHRRYESPCCAADAATTSAQSALWRRRKTPNLVRWRGPVFERRAIRWARTSSEGQGPGARQWNMAGLRGRGAGLVNVPCAIGHHRSCDGVSSEL
jgi:hypothetical protein